MHARTAIREAAATALGSMPSAPPVTVGGVYPEHVWPAVRVLTPAETIRLQENTTGAAIAWPQERDVALAIEIRSKGIADLLGELDTLAAEAESAIAADITLGGACDHMDLQETEVEIGDEQEQPTGLATLRYVVRYRTDATNPTTAIP